MPRSFMITHRRFGEDDPSKDISSNIYSSCEYSSYDKMHPSSSVHKYLNHVPNSPEFKNRATFTYRSFEKSVSGSDGESDSGSSFQADTRHEIAPELEYSLDCPSGLSLLLELMTQSPQRFSSRDILDLNLYRESNSPPNKQIKDDPEKDRADLQLGENKLTARTGATWRAGKVETTNMQIHPCTDSESNSKVVDTGKCIFEAAENRAGYVECTLYSDDGGFSVDASKNHGLEMNDISRIFIPSLATPVYEFQIYSGQAAKGQHVQRKISFDEGVHQIRSASPSDQPIDYSQLSSRRKERIDERKNEKIHYVVTSEGLDYIKEKPKDKAKRALHESQVATEMITSSPVVRQKYEFILSPTMDSNGNLVLPQSQKFFGRLSLPSNDQECPSKANDGSRNAYAAQIFDNRNETANYVQQNSPLSGSPASPVHCTADMKHETALEIAKAKFEPQKYDQEKAGVGKAQLTYHPKLKYLLATSQYASTKLNHDDERLPSAAASCPPPYPPYQQSVLFTQDQNAQAEKFQKLNDVNENVYTRGAVGQSQCIPSSEIFPAVSSAAGSNCRNTNVFIINPASTFKTCTSSISTSKGSSVCNNQQNIKDVPTSQTVSSPNVSQCFSACHTSDHFDKDTLMSMSPTSPGQPLSPASLRDQQSALSELLFSSSQKPGVDPYACADCGKRYSTSSNLARHRQTHRSVCDKKARKCPHCDKVYVSMPAYSMHVRTHNQGCECPHCGKKFSRPWLLQGHIRTHTGEKPFGCPQCGKSFADKSNLRAHIQTHSTEKPYVCGRCGKAFALKSYLYKHEESSCMRGQRFRH